jgi:hypothetical protein
MPPLTPIQAQNVSTLKPGLRVSDPPGDLNGAGYGLYTPDDMPTMMAWAQRGPPPEWYDQLWNTVRFILGMPRADTQVLVYVHNAGFPSNSEYYNVGGGRGDGRTLPKFGRIRGRIAAQIALRGRTEQELYDWVISLL